jgi:hypothetical protein
MKKNLEEELRQQYREFANIDDFNISQRVMRVPAEKHFWVERLIDAKKAKYKLLKEKKGIKDSIVQDLVSKNVTALTKQSLDKIEIHEAMEDINDRIHENEMLVEYLEHVVKAITFIGNDIKNILELRRMQEE